jgi:outer membrane immunogenic protein
MVRKSSSLLIVAAVIHLTASQSARAADIVPRGYAPAPAPVYVAPVQYVWTGCYVGGNVGGAWSRADLTDANGINFSASNGGFAGGGQIGCDYSWGAWVVGLRDMLDATSLSSSTTFSTIPFTGTVDSHTRWFDTLTARGGYLVAQNILLYVQGGAAWTNTDLTFFNGGGVQVGSSSNDRTGWTVGAGAEWMFAPRWSVFAEYNFMGFGTQSAAFSGCGGTCTLNAKADVQSVLTGVNYKF